MNSQGNNKNKHKNNNNFFMGISGEKNEQMNNNRNNKKNHNNFFMGISGNKNKIKNMSNNNIINKINNAKTPEDARTIVFGIIDKLEEDIVKLNTKINMMNKEKINIQHLSNKEQAKLKDVIKKLYMFFIIFWVL